MFTPLLMCDGRLCVDDGTAIVCGVGPTTELAAASEIVREPYNNRMIDFLPAAPEVLLLAWRTCPNERTLRPTRRGVKTLITVQGRAQAWTRRAGAKLR